MNIHRYLLCINCLQDQLRRTKYDEELMHLLRVPTIYFCAGMGIIIPQLY